MLPAIPEPRAGAAENRVTVIATSKSLVVSLAKAAVPVSSIVPSFDTAPLSSTTWVDTASSARTRAFTA